MGEDTDLQVSQSFNDGDLGVAWNRGVVFTAKEQGLWAPTSKVSAEDACHMRNRIQEFRLSHTITTLQDVESCAPCMARWIMKYSDEAAAGPVPIPFSHDVIGPHAHPSVALPK